MNIDNICIYTSTATDIGSLCYNEDLGEIVNNNKHVTSAIFDGHGGLDVVKKCADSLKLLCHLELEDIIKSFDENTTNMLGGTTCTIVKVSNESGLLSLAQLGDSNAYCFEYNSSMNNIPIWDDIMPSNVTKLSDCDHTPLNPTEFSRINAFGGKIMWLNENNTLMPTEKYPVFEWSEQENMYQISSYKYGRIKDCCGNLAAYFVIKSGASLSMTRSIGDHMFREYGLISIPYIRTHQLKSGTRNIIIIATDGLWDSVKPSEVYTFITEIIQDNRHKYEEPDKLANLITKELLLFGKIKGEELFGDMDNITINIMIVDLL